MLIIVEKRENNQFDILSFKLEKFLVIPKAISAIAL